MYFIELFKPMLVCVQRKSFYLFSICLFATSTAKQSFFLSISFCVATLSFKAKFLLLIVLFHLSASLSLYGVVTHFAKRDELYFEV